MLTPLYPVTNEPTTVTVAAPGALAGETFVPVASLEAALPSALILDFGSSKFAKLAAAAAVAAIALTTEPIPVDLDPGDEAEVVGSTAAYALLSEGVRGLTTDEQLALNIAAELAYDLEPGYTGNDAEQLSIAVARQMNLLNEMGVNTSRLKSVQPASPGPTRTYRDRWLDPVGAAIVARVTGRQAVRFEPMAVGL